jgi:hypothetical protein
MELPDEAGRLDDLRATRRLSFIAPSPSIATPSGVAAPSPGAAVPSVGCATSSPSASVPSAGYAAPMASYGGWEEVIGGWESTMEVLGVRYSAPMVASKTLTSHLSSMVQGESQILDRKEQ